MPIDFAALINGPPKNPNEKVFKALEKSFESMKIPKSKHVAFLMYQLPTINYKQICTYMRWPQCMMLSHLADVIKSNDILCKVILSIPYSEMKLQPFNKELVDWETLFEQFALKFMVHDISPEDEMKIIREYLGVEGLEYLNKIISPLEFDKLSFSILKLWVKEVVPSYSIPSVTISKKALGKRYEFFKRNQHCDEVVTDYYHALVMIAVDCEFGESITEHLRDRLVFGLKNPQLRKHCLNWCIPPPSGREAASVARKVEQTLEEQMSQLAVSKAKQKKKDQNKCSRCAKYGHYANDCKFLYSRCKKCSKRGHIQTACRTVTPGIGDNDAEDIDSSTPNV